MIARSFAAAFLLFASSLYASAAETEFPAPLDGEGAPLKIASITDLVQFQPLIEAFQKRYPRIAISYEESTSNMLDEQSGKACEDDSYFADLVISSSLPRQIWFVNEGCAESLAEVIGPNTPDWARWRDEIVGLTYEPAVIAYNKAAIPPGKVPNNRFELIDLLRQSDTYNEKIGTYDIELSGVGYFLAFEDSAQASTWGRILESMGRNKVQLFCCTLDILERVADGRLTFGYNLLGSYALDFQQKDDRLGIILPSDYTLVLTRAAFVPKTARNKSAAKLFISFALSPEGQKILGVNLNFGSPATGAARLRDLLSVNVDSLRPIALNPTLLVPLDREKRRTFIEQWRQSARR